MLTGRLSDKDGMETGGIETGVIETGVIEMLISRRGHGAAVVVDEAVMLEGSAEQASRSEQARREVASFMMAHIKGNERVAVD